MGITLVRGITLVEIISSDLSNVSLGYEVSWGDFNLLPDNTGEPILEFGATTTIVQNVAPKDFKDFYYEKNRKGHSWIVFIDSGNNSFTDYIPYTGGTQDTHDIEIVTPLYKGKYQEDKPLIEVTASQNYYIDGKKIPSGDFAGVQSELLFWAIVLSGSNGITRNEIIEIIWPKLQGNAVNIFHVQKNTLNELFGVILFPYKDKKYCLDKSGNSDNLVIEEYDNNPIAFLALYEKANKNDYTEYTDWLVEKLTDLDVYTKWLNNLLKEKQEVVS